MKTEKHMRWCFYFAVFSNLCFADWENSTIEGLKLLETYNSELNDQLESVFFYCIKYLQMGASVDSCSGSSAFTARVYSLQENL